MRLDHLLSKEEEVRVVLLLICQGANLLLRKQQLLRDSKIKILVAMRLGDTPVLIPNTMVKT